MTRTCTACGGKGWVTEMIPGIETGNDVPQDLKCQECNGRGQVELCACGGVFHFDEYCAAYVCQACGNHQGLDRCYCGWSVCGGDGRRELIEMGETIDPED